MNKIPETAVPHLCKILVVDDSSTIRAVLKKELESKGFTISTAADGVQGFNAARRGNYDLIITDVDMPDLDGFGLCSKLKEEQTTAAVPVVILSSLDSEQNIEKGFRVGAAAFVSKSSPLSELLSCVKDILDKRFLLHQRLILVVDDSNIIRNMVRDGLVQAGFQVMVAENGKKALDILRKYNPDLIISDLAMPEMNGYDLCAVVRSTPEWKTIPFVVMSTTSDSFVMRRMMQRGVCAYFVKPFNIEQLVINAEKLLSDHYQLMFKEKERIENERNILLGTITSLIQALEARDMYTCGHSETVAEIACSMAREMGFRDVEIERLSTAARLHDLGKIGIPDRILLKSGPLDEEEYLLIKQHPVIGKNILSSIESLQPILSIVLHHHERFDGKGYPLGLKGSRIPLWARIVAVADTYHAITSNRPYRKGFSSRAAVDFIKQASATQLCPECVAVFLKWIDGKYRG